VNPTPILGISDGDLPVLAACVCESAAAWSSWQSWRARPNFEESSARSLALLPAIRHHLLPTHPEAVEDTYLRSSQRSCWATTTLLAHEAAPVLRTLDTPAPVVRGFAAMLRNGDFGSRTCAALDIAASPASYDATVGHFTDHEWVVEGRTALPHSLRRRRALTRGETLFRRSTGGAVRVHWVDFIDTDSDLRELDGADVLLPSRVTSAVFALDYATRQPAADGLVGIVDVVEHLFAATPDALAEAARRDGLGPTLAEVASVLRRVDALAPLTPAAHYLARSL